MVTLAENIAAPRAHGSNGGGSRALSGGDGEQSTTSVNVGSIERAASLIGGGVLALYGAKRNDLAGALLVLVAASLAQRGATGHCPVYEGLGIDTSSAGGLALRKQHGDAAVLDASKAIKVEHAVTIARPAAELYRFWRNFENLPRIMNHLESVTVLDATRSRWKAKAPAGTSVEWDAVVHNEIPNQLIAWKSVDEATVPNAGSVHFTEVAGGGASEVKVVLEYDPPAGKLGHAVARLFGEEPDRQVRDDLQRFKAAIEAGEVDTGPG